MSAQSMTDDQVMKFIIKEHNSGTSQAQILSKLVAKGVDINQIRRIRKKYEKEIKDKSLGAVADKAVDDAGQVMRKNNGSERNFSQISSEESDNDPDYYYDKNRSKSKNRNNRKNYSDYDYEYNSKSKSKSKSKYSSDFDFEDEEDDTNIDDRLYKSTYDNKEMLFNGNRVFGRDIFNNTSLTFEPAMNLATPQSYVIGPGDNIKLWCLSDDYSSCDFEGDYLSLLDREKKTDSSPNNLLHTIQALVAGRKSKLDTPLNPEQYKDDASLTITAAPSKLREVEALHTSICKLIDSKKAKFSDILVVSPNLQDYCPAIYQVFDQARIASQEGRSVDGKPIVLFLDELRNLLLGKS